MAKRPTYVTLQQSPEFQNRSQAEDWAKNQKKIYKQADQSLRYDIKRTDSQGWRAVISAKV